MKYLIGNWKCHKSESEVLTWISQVKEKIPHYPQDVQCVLCPSVLYLPIFKKNYPQLKLGAQTVSHYPCGAYTGSVSTSQLKDYVTIAILGHSERRRYWAETPQIIARQASLSLEEGITPVIAIDRENYHSQLSQFSDPELSKIVLMYEPPEAIGSGEAAPVEEVIKTINEIKSKFSCHAVLYGGSVSSANIMKYWYAPNIDGVVPGSASLKAEEWIQMINLILAN